MEIRIYASEVSLRLSEMQQANSEKTVQYRFHRCAAFASQSAAVPAERAVLKASFQCCGTFLFQKLNV